MKKNNRKKSKSILVSIIVAIIIAMMISGCGGNSSDTTSSETTSSETTSSETTSSDTTSSDTTSSESTSLDSSFDSSDEVKEDEIVSFEGVKLSQLTQLTLNEHIDFTIPYTWTFGRIDADEESVKEAIAVTGDKAVMTIFLKNVQVSDEKALLSEEMSNLNSTYPEYDFKKSELFENEVAIIEGTSEQGDVKMYIAIIPKGEESVWVTYAYESADSLAEMYFTGAISEMLQKK